MAKYDPKSGGHAGDASKNDKPYLSHVSNESLRTHHNGKHSDHPTNNMSHHRLHSVKGGGDMGMGMGEPDGDESC